MKRRLLVVGIPLAIVALLLIAWTLDTRAHEDEALRNVEVGGRDVGGLDPEALADAVADVAATYDDAEIVVTTSVGAIETTAAAVGLAVDVDATVEAALDEGRDDPLPIRPVRWLTSLAGGREAGVVAHVDRTMVRALVAAEDPTERTDAKEPGITGDSGDIAVVLGGEGNGIDADEVADSIEEAAASGSLPIEVEVEPGTIEPRFTRADAETLAEEAASLTAQPLGVAAGETQASIPASTIRSWLRSEPGPDSLELALDSERVLADLRGLLPGVATEPASARITVEGGRPVILPGVQGVACCDPTAVGYLLGAVKAGHANDPGHSPVDLPLTTVDPETTTEELEALEITQEIGSFTTRHAAGESRVTNIHRIADIVRGVVLAPGETFSVNGFVGERTTEKGFVSGGVIENGSFSESVGGGISQFATTLFNAAFFGGLDFVEYQSHSIYISRYPYGREATLSFPKPDLIIENSTPHGVLIWPTYTSSSITVTLYSTPYAKGAQTAQSEAPVGVAGCKRVTTTRTRTYVDGHTEEDRVAALYRPGEGVQCDGPAPTTTTTTAPPPAETTTTQPSPGG